MEDFELKIQKNEQISNFPIFDYKIDLFFSFWNSILGQNLDFWRENSIISCFINEIFKKSSNFGAKIWTFSKVKVCQNWIFGRKIDIMNSV